MKFTVKDEVGNNVGYLILIIWLALASLFALYFGNVHDIRKRETALIVRVDSLAKSHYDTRHEIESQAAELLTLQREFADSKKTADSLSKQVKAIYAEKLRLKIQYNALSNEITVLRENDAELRLTIDSLSANKL